MWTPDKSGTESGPNDLRSGPFTDVPYTSQMSGNLFDDPRSRRAYIWTKVAMFAVAAIATWPLSRIVGPKAWWGLGIFGAVLIVLGAVVLASGGHEAESDGETDDDNEASAPPDSPVDLPIEDFIDLHAFSPKDVQNVVEDYLAAAHAEGFREIRLIHGRGIGVQRERVRSVLARHPLVTEFHDGSHDRGGWGATIARLVEDD